jgi:hypothetical protein
LNLILTWPVYALTRFVLPQFERRDRVERIQALG